MRSNTRLNSRRTQQILAALSDECLRNIKGLKVSGYPRIYYLSYLLREIHTTHIWGRLGNLNQCYEQRARNAYCDCRVGSHAFDQVAEGGLDDHSTEAESYEYLEMPIGDDLDALKYHLWRLTDCRYREAVQHYFQKKSQHVTYRDPNWGLASFRKGTAERNHTTSRFTSVDLKAWGKFIETSSRIVKADPRVKTSTVELRVRDVVRFFVNSEGSQLVDQTRVCELTCDFGLLTKEGETVTTRITHVTATLDELPSLKQFSQEIRDKIALLVTLAKAPSLKSYAGPVLLAPGPAGVLFHEVLGHRLEGSRLLSTREGQTFKLDLGKAILPSAITVYDDPTLRVSEGVHTVGAYRYDDEGSPGEKVVLVDRGKLSGFLSGRAPILKHALLPNGHARNEYHERPISRMANLVVEIENGLSETELKKRFVEEIRRLKLPFGIMILEAESGETATETYDFQAFMGMVSLAIQVWADGRENYIRNINFVGTPLSVLRNIVAAGDRAVCINAFCGAESGAIPVSTTSPAILLSNLELQANEQRRFAPFVLPMPHEPSAKKSKS